MQPNELLPTRKLFALAFFTCILTPSIARADSVCSTQFDPISLGLRIAASDANQSVCPRNQVSVRGVARAAIDTPNFYGSIGGDVAVAADFRLRTQWSFGVTVRALDYAFAQNAVVKATQLSAGPVVLSGKWTTGMASAKNRFAAYVAAALPGTVGPRHELTTAGQASVLAGLRLGAKVVLHGRIGAIWQVTSSGGERDIRGAGLLGATLIRTVGRRMGLGFGVDGQSGYFSALDHFLLSGSLQVRVAAATKFQFGVAVPIAGSDRTTAALLVGLVSGRQ